MDIFINGSVLEFESFELKLTSLELINTLQIYTNKTDIKIDDTIFITHGDFNPLITFKVKEIIETLDNDRFDTLIIAKSVEYELMQYRTVETIQFNPNESINNILSAYGFTNLGEDFKLLYDNTLTIPIGSNLGLILKSILYQHGYIFANSPKYNLNIKSIKISDKQHNIEFIESLRLHRVDNYKSIGIYGDNNPISDDKWAFSTSPIGEYPLMIKSLLNSSNSSFLEISDNIKLFEQGKSAILDIKIASLAIIPQLNDTLSLTHLYESINNSFRVVEVIINEDNKIKIKGFVNV
jgi:hypothetical protein